MRNNLRVHRQQDCRATYERKGGSNQAAIDVVEPTQQVTIMRSTKQAVTVLAILLMCAIALAQQSPSEKQRVVVKETPSARRTADDPMLKGGRLDPSGLAKAASENRGKGGGPQLMKDMHWMGIVDVTLASWESHKITVPLSEPSLVLVRATWAGSVPELILAKDGVTLTKGTLHRQPPDRGTLTAKAEVNPAGAITLSVSNNGNVPVRLRIAVGTLALSILRR